MKSYEYNACVFKGEILCNECLHLDVKTEEVQPIFADSEWDSYPVCSKCGEVHDYVVLLDYATTIKKRIERQP
jgi:hypothetical protein